MHYTRFLRRHTKNKIWTSTQRNVNSVRRHKNISRCFPHSMASAVLEQDLGLESLDDSDWALPQARAASLEERTPHVRLKIGFRETSKGFWNM